MSFNSVVYFILFCLDSLCIRESGVLKSPASAEMGLVCIMKSSGTLFMRLDASELVSVCLVCNVFMVNCSLHYNEVSFLSSGNFSLESVLSDNRIEMPVCFLVLLSWILFLLLSL